MTSDAHLLISMRPLLLAGMLFFMAGVAVCQEEAPPLLAAHAQQPLVIYYSRTGTSFAIAGALSQALACEREEIRSKKYRYYLGVLTCVFDQLLDREDEIETLTRDSGAYNPIIIVSPIWIHKLASPVRTALKYFGLQGKTMYVVATNNGNFSGEDESAVRAWLSRCGAEVRWLKAIQTNGMSFEKLSSLGSELAGRIQSEYSDN